MYKFTFLIVLLGSLINANASKNWTIALSSTKNINNAKYFIKKNIGKTNKDIFIFKANNRYRVTLGAFDTYLDAKKFLNRQSRAIKRSKPYILKSKYDLHGNKIPNLVTLITTRKIVKAKPKPVIKVKKVVKEKNQKVIKVVKQKDNIKKALENKQSVKEVDFTKKTNKKTLEPKKSKYELLVSYAPTKISGDIELFSKGEVKIKDDLGLDNNMNNFKVELITNYETAKVYLGTKLGSISSTNTLSKDISLSNTTYASGSKIDSKLDQQWFYVGYKDRYKGPFHYGLELVSYDSDFEIEQTKIENSYSFLAINGNMKHKIDRFVLDYGLSLGKGVELDYRNYFLNINRDISFIKNSNIQVGYENNQIEADKDNFNSNINYQSLHIDFIKRF